MGTFETMRRLRILSLVAFLLTSGTMAAASRPTVDHRMLLGGGDVLNDEILIFQRLRAERRVALDGDDSPPIVCKDSTGRIYLVSGSGKLLTSNFDGEAFSNPCDIVVGLHRVTDVQAMGALKGDKIVVAYGNNGKLCLARSEDSGADLAARPANWNREPTACRRPTESA